MDFNKRREIYQEFEKALYDNYEDMFLFYSWTITAYRKNVAGYSSKLFELGSGGFYHSHPMWLRDGGK